MKMTDIAKKANVSIATVSRVINNEKSVRESTRLKVLKIIEENEYTPSAVGRNLSKQETNIVAVIVPDISNPFFSEIVDGITKVLEAKDLGVVLFNTGESIERQEKAIKMAVSQRVKGIIISVTQDSYNLEGEKILKSKDIPLVLIDRDIKNSNIDGVFIDNIHGAYKGVKSLLEQGHKNISILTGSLESKPGRDRLRGYKKALKEYDITLEEDNIYEGNFQLESGYRLGKELLEKKDIPESVFICNNLMTLGFMKAINRSKYKIIEDIDIATFDRIESLDIFGIDINYVSIEARDLGTKGATLLLNRLNNKDMDTCRLILSPELTKRKDLK